jgi:hypothetical protein
MLGTMINLLKLCVGATSVEDLIDWQHSQRRSWPDGCAIHVTRMWPKREADLLEGGSLYWVIKGVILARQRLVDLQEVNLGDGIPAARSSSTRRSSAPKPPPAVRSRAGAILTPRTAPATCPRAAPRTIRCPRRWHRPWRTSDCTDPGRMICTI